MMNHGLHGIHGWGRMSREKAQKIVQSPIALLAVLQTLHALNAQFSGMRVLTPLLTQFADNPIVVSLQRESGREESAA